MHGAWLSGGVIWREATAADCECELGMGIGLRHLPLSSESLMRSILVTPIYTEGSRVLHKAGLNDGMAWR